MSELDQRRIALCDELAGLLSASGLSGRQIAKETGWQPSKVSRILNGKQAVTDADIATWCTATAASDADAERLRAEPRAIRAEEMRWSRQLGTGHRAAQEDMIALERNASHIRAVDLTLVPGLLQTGEYAAALFRKLAEIRKTPRDTDEAVRVRMQRQNVLYDSSKRIELVISEFALRHPIGDRSVMAAQLDRIHALQGLPAVKLGFVPLNAALPVPPLHGFHILGDRVLIENLHREESVEQPDDVALYNRMADALWTVAVEQDEARAILLRVMNDLTGRSVPG